MNNPLISVIIPVYNVERYLDECLLSITNQTYTNLEILLVNDGSTDNTPKICEEWVKKDSRIKVIHKENGGASSARNVGLDVAKGAYIGFVDGDDFVAKDMYEKLLSALYGTDIKVSCSSALRVFDKSEISNVTTRTYKKVLDVNEAVDEFFFTESTSVCDKLFAASVFSNVRFPVGESNEELSLFIPLIVRSGGIVFIGDQLYFYRCRVGSITNSNRYLQDSNSDTVYKNLSRIDEQIKEYKLPCSESFRYFKSANAYNMAITMEKAYLQLSDKVKADYCLYREIMKENIFPFLWSPYSKFKDKILYLLVLTKLLRPLYKIFSKN